MRARCFTWNNWRGSGKCEKPRERLKRPQGLAIVPRGTLEVDGNANGLLQRGCAFAEGFRASLLRTVAYNLQQARN